MDDYISRQLALDELEKQKDETVIGFAGRFYNKIIQCDIEKIEMVPSADVRENVRGKWRNNNLGNGIYQIYCSECKYTSLRKTNYCPNCGAYMKSD